MNKAYLPKKIQRYILPTIAVLLSVIFFFWLQQLPNSQPLFLLSPICAVVSSFASFDFVFRPDIGFLGMTRQGVAFIVDKSCSGGTFLTICFSLLSFTQLPKFKKLRSQIILFPILLFISYLMAILASIIRIIPSIIVLDMVVTLDPVLTHNIIGIVSFIAVICGSYLLVDTLVSKAVIRRMKYSGK